MKSWEKKSDFQVESGTVSLRSKPGSIRVISITAASVLPVFSVGKGYCVASLAQSEGGLQAGANHLYGEHICSASQAI